MSRLYEALQKTGQAAPDLDAPLLGEPAVAAASPTAAAAAAAAPAPEEPRPAPPPPEPVRTLVTEPLRAVGGSIRTLPVRLKACDAVLPFDARSRRSVEQYRLIRTKISHRPGSPQLLAVTSAGPGDGKTITSINVAGAMSLKAGVRILIVDGDLRRSSIARMLGIPERPGLTDVIAQKCDLDDAIVRIEQFPNCFVLPAGTRSPNPPELLDSQNWRALCEVLRARYQYTIFDTPPVASVADYDLIQASVDGVVMVVRPEHTKRAAFKKAVGAIPQEKLIGLILNDVTDWFLWTAQSGQSYAYYDALDMTQTTVASGKRG